MRITYQSPDALVIRDRAAALRAAGVVFAVVGAGFIVLAYGWRGTAGAWVFGLTAVVVAVMVGVPSVLGGVLLALLPPAATFAFDRSQQALIVTRRSLLSAAKRETYRLRDIAAVELEAWQQRDDPRYRRLAARMDDGTRAATFRVVTVMADGSRHPWTSYYTSERAGMSAAVEAARQFVGLPSSAAPATREITPAPAQRAANRPAQQRTPQRFLATMALFSLPFLPYGAWRAWEQHRQLTTYRPVSVMVLAVGVKDVSGGRRSTFRPVVTYRYDVGGRSYTGGRVTPLNESRSGRWAFDVAGRYGVGGTYTGYYDPARPSESFLVRRSSPAPFIFIGIPLLLMLARAAVTRSTRRSA